MTSRERWLVPDHDPGPDLTVGEAVLIHRINALAEALRKSEDEQGGVAIPYRMASELKGELHAIVMGNDPKDVFQLHPVKKRTDMRRYCIQKCAALKVREYLAPYGTLNPEAAYSKVLEELLADEDMNEMVNVEDTKTIANWYHKFFDPEK